MVCVACLLPIFLIPIVNLLPKLLDMLVARVASLFGYEYKATARPAPACPLRRDNQGPTATTAGLAEHPKAQDPKSL